MNRPCEEFADRIVAYVDGELSEGEAQAVARHLAECDRCRRTVKALARSLSMTRALWSDNLGESELAAQSASVRRPRRIRFYAVAASILVAASLLMLTIPRHHMPSDIHLEELERQIVRAGMAAELLAATQIIAQCEGTEAIVEQQNHYILREYADTPAAESIRAQRGLRLGDMQ